MTTHRQAHTAERDPVLIGPPIRTFFCVLVRGSPRLFQSQHPDEAKDLAQTPINPFGPRELIVREQQGAIRFLRR